MTPEHFRFSSPVLSGKGLGFGGLAPFKPPDPLQELSAASGASAEHQQCGAIVYLGCLMTACGRVRGVVLNLVRDV